MPDQTYTIHYEARADYLVARISGPSDSVAIKLAYLAEVAAACRARGLHKLLIIEDLGGVISASDLPRLTAAIAPLVKGLIIAFTDLKAEHHEINRLGEGMAVDQGAVGRVFRTLPEAEKWIAAVP